MTESKLQRTLNDLTPLDTISIGVNVVQAGAAIYMTHALARLVPMPTVFRVLAEISFDLLILNSTADSISNIVDDHSHLERIKDSIRESIDTGFKEIKKEIKIVKNEAAHVVETIKKEVQESSADALEKLSAETE